jgi:hypothetical protein
MNRIVLSVLLVYGISCQQSDDFYARNLCGYDCSSIALVPPYCLKNTSGSESTWYLDTELSEGFAYPVTEVGVVDSVIIGLYYPRDAHLKPVDSIWYVVRVKEKKIVKLSSFDQLKQELKSERIGGFRTDKVSALWEELGLKRRLYWFPSN